jgi:hypothetical protein
MGDVVTKSHDEMLADLLMCDFICGPRDVRLNTRYPGKFMVVEEEYRDMDLPTEDGSNGPWCIVGDDFPALVKTAWEIWWPEYTRNGERALIVANLSE